jgi:hypothetical protein
MNEEEGKVVLAASGEYRLLTGHRRLGGLRYPFGQKALEIRRGRQGFGVQG